jgi:hypothetical protein
METLKLIGAGALGFGIFWFSRKIREWFGVRAIRRFKPIEEDIAKSVLENNNRDLDDLVTRENERLSRLRKG